ncbi:MAG: zinc ribbon domain-containing protein [Hydrogenobaculum sp.]
MGYLFSFWEAERNRKNTQEFECRACKNKINAQINGAKNILKRSSLGSLYMTKKQVLKILIERCLERLKGCKSPPLDILKEYSKPLSEPDAELGMHRNICLCKGEL